MDYFIVSCFLSLSAVRSPVVPRTSPAVRERRRRKTPSRCLQALPSPALARPTVDLSWMTLLKAASPWLGSISYLLALRTGVWRKCVDSFPLYKVSFPVYARHIKPSLHCPCIVHKGKCNSLMSLLDLTSFLHLYMSV